MGKGRPSRTNGKYKVQEAETNLACSIYSREDSESGRKWAKQKRLGRWAGAQPCDHVGLTTIVKISDFI